MNKANLIDAVAVKLACSKADAGKFVDAVFESVKDGLKKVDDVVKIVNFGTFKVVMAAEKRVSNPQTKTMMTIPASEKVRFSPSKNIK